MTYDIIHYFQIMLAMALDMLTHPNFPFVFLFIFRYLRLVVHLISFWCLYKPAPVPANPTLKATDCTIIIPTVEPDNPDFTECLQTVLYNGPGAILIVTVGQSNLHKANQIVNPLREAYPNTTIRVSRANIANKRHQVAFALPQVQTAITVLVDDHVFWPSANFLPTLLAPFEDPQVGVVGTNKRVRRFDTGFGNRAFWNMIGALYLERHNFEIRATNAIDGGVFVISGRTSAHRSCILQDPAFIAGFTDERFFFGKFGPLNADDDNFITRWEVSHGWKIKIQYSKDAMIETTLGTYPRFLSQCLRWVRTTWRSNSASLFTDRTVWRAQPWCVYAVYITSFFNFALFYDAALMYTLSHTSFGSANLTTSLCVMAGWIFASKMVKLTPYFLRHPQDLIYLPGYFVFAYYHSLIKLYAGLTFWVTAWGGRNLAAVGNDGDNDGNDHDDTNGDDHAPRPGSNASSRSSSSLSSSSSSSSSGSSQSSGGVALAQADGISSWSHLFSLSSWRPFGVFNLFTNGKTKTDGSAINTPWGAVSSKNKHLKPANVLQSQNPLAIQTNQPNSFSLTYDSDSTGDDNHQQQPNTFTLTYSSSSSSDSGSVQGKSQPPSAQGPQSPKAKAKAQAAAAAIVMPVQPATSTPPTQRKHYYRVRECGRLHSHFQTDSHNGDNM